jgi:hypothetical protein
VTGRCRHRRDPWLPRVGFVAAAVVVALGYGVLHGALVGASDRVARAADTCATRTVEEPPR